MNTCDTLSWGYENVNAWKISDFTAPAKTADGGYKTINKTDPSKAIYIPTTTYPNRLSDNGNAIIASLVPELKGYFGLPYPNNYMIISGIRGKLTELAITYWGDFGYVTNHIAKRVVLYADNAAVGIKATRSGAAGAKKYSFDASFKELVIYNQLKIVFEDITTTADGGEALIHQLFFTLK
jgi:hypothetical protein